MEAYDRLWDKAANQHSLSERPISPKPAIHEAAMMALV
jgi:hypothetical protein